MTTTMQDAPPAEKQAEMMEKVRKLLAKAESCAGFGTEEGNHEAEAFMGAAQKLIAAYAISEAMLSSGKGKFEEIEVRSMHARAPYAMEKTLLLQRICKVNRVELVMTAKRPKAVTVQVVGFPSDLDAVDLLFTSLLVQMVGECMNATPEWFEQIKQFRASFMMAFTDQVGQRLQEAVDMATAEAEVTTSSSVALVLVDRAGLVKDRFRKEFPGSQTQSVSRTRNQAGQDAGAAAGQRANIGQRSVGQRARLSA